jgi:hypothetical protein
MPETSFAILGNPMRAAESVRMEMACIVRLAAEPVRPDDHIGALIRRAATRLGLNYSRANTRPTRCASVACISSATGRRD